MTLDREATKMTHERLSGLLDGGDWACAHAQQGGLVEVCHELAGLLDPALATRSQTIALLAKVDMFEASGEWDKLSNLLRSCDVAESALAAVGDPERTLH